MKKYLLAMFCLFWGHGLWAQTDYSFWEQNVGWDGQTHWSHYIIRSPRHMGPNALPIPIQREPRLDSSWQFELVGEFHQAPGDYTQNPYVFIRLPLAPGRVALDLTWRPMEWFQTDEQVRDFRRARGEGGRGSSPGDVWITTVVQLLRQNDDGSGLNLTLNVAVKTTAGKNLENARHTNTPGYIFDLHAGKSWKRQGSLINRISLFGNGGLWVWQEGLAQQNDAFNYGIRAEFEHGPWRLGTGFTGYIGWINNGDRPYAARGDLQYHTNRLFYLLGYQHAFQDLTTHMLRAGMGLKLPTRP
ncbi:MAG: hypothetical protein ACK417_09555 [Bacteroidia bacterium]